MHHLLYQEAYTADSEQIMKNWQQQWVGRDRKYHPKDCKMFWMWKCLQMQQCATISKQVKYIVMLFCKCQCWQTPVYYIIHDLYLYTFHLFWLILWSHVTYMYSSFHHPFSIISNEQLKLFTVHTLLFTFLHTHIFTACTMSYFEIGICLVIFKPQVTVMLWFIYLLLSYLTI